MATTEWLSLFQGSHWLILCLCVSSEKDRCLLILQPKDTFGFPGGLDGKESACNAGDLGSVPGLGRCPGGWHGNALQYSCLENPHGQRSLAGYSPWGCRESNTTELLRRAQKPSFIWRNRSPFIPRPGQGQDALSNGRTSTPVLTLCHVLSAVW